MYFESLRRTSRGTTVLSKDTIYDPFAKNENGGHGKYIDIAYIVGRRPTVDSNGREQDPNEFGRIQFRKKQDGGQILIRGGNKRDELLFDFLFLTNQSQSNVGKEWFIPNEMRGPCFRFVQKHMDATAELEKDRKYRLAADRIDAMPDSKLREFAEGLDLKGVNKHTSEDEIRVKLLKLAKAEGGPDKILSIDKDITFHVKVKLKEAEKLGIVARDNQINSLVWADSGEPIVNIPPNKNVYEFLTAYFVGKGSKVFEMIGTLVDRKNELKKAEEANKLSDTDDGKKSKAKK